MGGAFQSHRVRRDAWKFIRPFAHIMFPANVLITIVLSGKETAAMRAICISLVVGLSFLCASASAERNLADYPIRISILDQPTYQSRSLTGVWTYYASGHANLQDGDTTYAADYSYECTFRLPPTTPDAPYRAKWSKPQTRLKVLAAVVGEPNKYAECEIKTTVLDGVYVRQSGQAVLVSKSEYARWKAERQQATSADYPMEISLIEEGSNPVMNMTTATGAPQTRFQGSGRGNLYAGQEAHGFEFNYDCGFRLFPKNRYPARWLIPQQRMEVLRTGAGQSFQGPTICQLTVSMKQEVYLSEPGAGVTGEASPGQVSQRNSAEGSAGLPVGPAGVEVPAGTSVPPPDRNANLTKVAISSDPMNADIEVDGNYVGSTPSTLSLAVGPHRIIVRKRGFEAWQREIQIIGGETYVHADLEEKKPGNTN